MSRPQESHADLGEHYGEPVTDYFKPRRTPETNKAPERSPAKNAATDAFDHNPNQGADHD